jgi:hypothetical protein
MSGDRPFAIPSTLQRRTPATRLTWALRATCVLLIVWSVTTGWRSWQERPVRDTVHAFFQALIDGQNEVARTFLAPEIRHQLPPEDLTGRSVPLEETTLHLNSVQLQGMDATVAVSVKRAGYELTPTVRLRRQPDGAWQLTQITGVAIDPRWLLNQSRAQEVETESLEEELRAGFTPSATPPPR